MGYVPGTASLLAPPQPVLDPVAARARRKMPRNQVPRRVREGNLRRKIPGRSSKEPGIQRTRANEVVFMPMEAGGSLPRTSSTQC